MDQKKKLEKLVAPTEPIGVSIKEEIVKFEIKETVKLN